VVIAVIAVRMMKMPVDEVVDMIAMRNRFVTTAVRRTLIGIFCAELDPMFVYMIAVRMVQMAIMDIVDVVAMLDCGVSTARAMLMVMLGVMRLVASAHAYLLCSFTRARPSAAMVDKVA
jgi:hypothetical protein